ncbi:hypothetical protein QJQ45_009936 [Haematococcus lacustris]|nr:hypothetical protein QJQ45_009936 [Haematococcus lacustris]
MFASLAVKCVAECAGKPNFNLGDLLAAEAESIVWHWAARCPEDKATAQAWARDAESELEKAIKERDEAREPATQPVSLAGRSDPPTAGKAGSSAGGKANPAAGGRADTAAAGRADTAAAGRAAPAATGRADPAAAGRADTAVAGRVGGKAKGAIKRTAAALAGPLAGLQGPLLQQPLRQRPQQQ